MIEISISSELAAAHPQFIADCAERGHRLEVFESSGSDKETDHGRDVSRAIGQRLADSDAPR